LSLQATPDPRTEARRGVAATVVAFTIWGLFPLYLKPLTHVPAIEILAHRIAWCLLFVLGWLAWKGRLHEVTAAVRDRGVLARLVLSAALIAVNWGLYVWAVSNGRVLEASLGYFIGPLVNVLLGYVFLKERLSPLQFVAVIMAAAGTVYLGWFLGTPPWISLSLAFSFGVYGLVRKMLNVGPMVGLLWETLLLALPALVFVAWSAQHGSLYFGTAGTGQDILLGLAGLVTVLPLVWFNVAARSLRLTTLGFFQYIAPSMTFLLSVFVYGEPFTRGHAVAFGCIWFALAMISAESWKRSRAIVIPVT